MRLCCLHDGTVGLSLSRVFLESVSEDGQLAIGLEATEGRWPEGFRCPACGHDRAWALETKA